MRQTIHPLLVFQLVQVQLAYARWLPREGNASLFPRAKREGTQLHTLPLSTTAFPLKRSGFPELKADLPEDWTRDGNSQSREAEAKPLSMFVT